jgi:PAP_fibrillin
MQAEQRQVILDLIQQLEGHGSTEGITQELQRVAGDWRLLFSTIAITVGFGWPSPDNLTHS